MARKQGRHAKRRSKEPVETSPAVARETAGGRLVASPTSKRVIKETSAAHREALMRLVDR